MIKGILLICVFGIFSPQVNAGIFGPSNYDDCILESMKGVTSDSAAYAITRSCKQKFPAKISNKNSRELKGLEVNALTGRGGLSHSNYFWVDLYNGNKDVTISEISILVETKISGQSRSTVYTVPVDIPPQKTVGVGFSIVVGDKGASYQWSPLSGKGY